MAALVRLSEQYSQRDDIILRIYWLLIVNPELDPQRSAFEWLVVGLRRCGLAGRLRSLYERELAREPAKVREECGAELLEVPAAPPAIAEVARIRWRAAGQLGAWEIIFGDLDRLRSKTHGETDDLWIGLLLGAFDQLAWVPTTDKSFDRLGALRKEISTLELHHRDMWQQFDRLDYLLTLATQWRCVLLRSKAPPKALAVLPLTWNGPDGASWRAVEALAETVLQGTETALDWLDVIGGESEVVLQHLHSALVDLKYTRPAPDYEERDIDGLKLPLCRLMLDCLAYAYGKIRLPLLHFCIREAVSPHQVATLIEETAEIAAVYGEDIPGYLRGDLALQSIYMAHAWYWA